VSVFDIVERHLGRGLGHKWLEIPVDKWVYKREPFPRSQNFVIPAKAGTQSTVVSKTLMTLIPAFAGGCPATTHFLCFAKESKQRKATQVHRFCRDKACDKNPLRYSKRQAAAELLGRIVLVSDASNVASSSNSPRGMPLSLLRCSATLNGNSKARIAACLLPLFSGEGREFAWGFVKRASRQENGMRLPAHALSARWGCTLRRAR
jgi:hypothetical protein